MNNWNKELDLVKGKITDFDDSQSEILKEFYSESNPKSHSTPPKRWFKYDKEVSIRELQFQQKIKEIERIENMNDSFFKDMQNKRFNRFEDVLVNWNKKNLKNSLKRYNKRENLSVERIAHSESTSNIVSPTKIPWKKSAARIKPKPTIDISIDKMYFITESEETANWNELSNKQLEDKVRQSIKDVDKVLNLNWFSSSRSTPTLFQDDNKEPDHPEALSHFGPSQTPFEKFRSMLNKGLKYERKPQPKSSVHTNIEDDENVFLPELSNSPNLRYDKYENYDSCTGSHENNIQKQSTIETSEQKHSSAKRQLSILTSSDK